MSDSPPVPVAAEVWTIHPGTTFISGPTPKGVIRVVRESELVSARELLAEAREALREIEQIEPKGDRLQNPSAHAMRDYAREALAVPDRSTKDDDDG